MDTESRKIKVKKAALASKKKSKPSSKKMRSTPPKPPLKMYRSISLAFVVVVTLVLAFVVYISTTNARIFVKSTTQEVDAEFLVDIVRTPTTDNELRGRIISSNLGRTKSFEPGGDNLKEVPGTAKGIVTLHNDSSTAQPLVATTRLHLEDGTQFRIQSAVTVPANGTADVEAHADFEGAAGDIGPSRFTIPGLNAAKQQVIYATNSEPFTGGLSHRAIISQEDIDAAAAELRDELLEEMKEKIRKDVGEVFSGEQFIGEVVSQENSVQAGAEAGDFSITMSVKGTGIFYDADSLGEIAQRALYQKLMTGFEFIDSDSMDPDVVIDRYDGEAESANFRVKLSQRAIASSTSKALDSGRFVGLSAEEIKDMLIREEVATDVRVEFTPSWIKRAPRLKDHIFVEIE